MSGHTRGPWRWAPEEGTWGLISDGRASRPAVLVHHAFWKPTAPDMALIAAAPDLLYALRQIIADLPSRRDWLDPSVEEAARAAIAKATGADQ